MHDELDLRGESSVPAGAERRGGVRPLGDVLAELLAQYQARYPNLHITVVEAAPAAA